MSDQELENVLDQAQPTEPVEEERQLEEREEKPIASPSNMDNIRRLREEKENYQRQVEELRRQNEEYSQFIQKHNTPQEEESDFTYNDDDLVEGKHLSQVTKKIQQLEQRLAQQQKQAMEMTSEARLKATYPDFDKVVTHENVVRLREEYPHFASMLAESSDVFTKGAAAHDLIKRLNIYKEDSFVDDKYKALQNNQKPRALNSLPSQHTDSALSNAARYNAPSEEEKKRHYKEMMEAIQSRR